MKNYYAINHKFKTKESTYQELRLTEYEFDTFHPEEFNRFVNGQVTTVGSLEINSVTLLHSETQSERTIHRYSSMLEVVKSFCDIYQMQLEDVKSKSQSSIVKAEFFDRMMEWSKKYHEKRNGIKEV